MRSVWSSCRVSGSEHNRDLNPWSISFSLSRGEKRCKKSQRPQFPASTQSKGSSWPCGFSDSCMIIIVAVLTLRLRC
jgi:hypothetical protein